MTVKKLNLKFVLLMLVMMFILGACYDSKNDEPQQTETGVFKNLKKCPVTDAYKGEILDLSYPDNDGYDGVWCQIKAAPNNAWSKGAPDVRSYIFFERSNFEGIELPVGKTIAFRILKYEVDTYRFHIIFTDMPAYNYFNCRVKPIN